MPVVNRTYTPRTTRLLREYIASTYPQAKRIGEFHLTQANPDAIARAGGNVSPRFGGRTLGYMDALVVTADEVAMWEAKHYLTSAAIGQIEGYAMLWPRSVESHEYAGLTLTLHMLVAHDNPSLHALAASKGIEIAVYYPQWYADSERRTESIAAQRQTDAQVAVILSHVATGHIPDAAAIEQMRELGVSQFDAQERVVAAHQHAVQPSPAQG